MSIDPFHMLTFKDWITAVEGGEAFFDTMNYSKGKQSKINFWNIDLQNIIVIDYGTKLRHYFSNE